MLGDPLPDQGLPSPTPTVGVTNSPATRARKPSRTRLVCADPEALFLLHAVVQVYVAHDEYNYEEV